MVAIGQEIARFSCKRNKILSLTSTTNRSWLASLDTVGSTLGSGSGSCMTKTSRSTTSKNMTEPTVTTTTLSSIPIRSTSTTLTLLTLAPDSTFSHYSISRHNVHKSGCHGNNSISAHYAPTKCKVSKPVRNNFYRFFGTFSYFSKFKFIT